MKLSQTVTRSSIDRRVLIIGSSGSGKSTLGRHLADRLGVPFIELDGLYHGPNWSEPSDEDFRERVRMATAGGEWVVDGNYSKVGLHTWERADTIVWLDLPFPISFTRMVRRTFRRCFRKEELWNGNRERLWPQFFGRDSLFYYTAKTFRSRRRKFAALMETDLGYKMIRLRTSAEVKAFLDAIE